MGDWVVLCTLCTNCWPSLHARCYLVASCVTTEFKHILNPFMWLLIKLSRFILLLRWGHRCTVWAVEWISAVNSRFELLASTCGHSTQVQVHSRPRLTNLHHLTQSLHWLRDIPTIFTVLILHRSHLIGTKLIHHLRIDVHVALWSSLLVDYRLRAVTDCWFEHFIRKCLIVVQLLLLIMLLISVWGLE